MLSYEALLKEENMILNGRSDYRKKTKREGIVRESEWVGFERQCTHLHQGRQELVSVTTGRSRAC